MNKRATNGAIRGQAANNLGTDHASVRIHTNSSAPASVGARAYTQGQIIHLAPSQTNYLPHETTHVVQQMSGRVSFSGQHSGASPLESQADNAGIRAVNGQIQK